MVTEMKIINNPSQILSNSLGLFAETKEKGAVSFSDMFAESLKNADRLEKESQNFSEKIASGQVDNIHEAMIAAQKADISMQLILQVRNKVLDAYREITRMQI
ncbi:flagellar hook-basal body complex protein FliE [Alkaliphilus serpentinus]|uniref:Flagellar hook-basal body complex protein FliE n=2 Tax=Alkaliphilus serpentinus TaxID=1482731 RepID=A0A833HQC8_9FIRM|nr:flagellar hook-basal body complex protein FliE [Alkaliphilus serpentinus]